MARMTRPAPAPRAPGDDCGHLPPAWHKQKHDEPRHRAKVRAADPGGGGSGYGTNMQEPVYRAVSCGYKSGCSPSCASKPQLTTRQVGSGRMCRHLWTAPPYHCTHSDSHVSSGTNKRPCRRLCRSWQVGRQYVRVGGCGMKRLWQPGHTTGADTCWYREPWRDV